MTAGSVTCPRSLLGAHGWGKLNLPQTPFLGKFVVLRGKNCWRDSCLSYSSAVGRRLRGRLTVARRRGCCVRYNVKSRKHASLRPELVVIRIHDVVQQRLVRGIDIKCLAPDGQNANGPDSVNDDAAVRANLSPSADLDRPIFDHHGRSLYGQYGIQVRLANPSRFRLHGQSKNRSRSRINR